MDPLFELLRPTRLTAVVDVGANPIDGEPPYKRMLAAGLCTVTGFEPQAEALASLNQRKGPHEQYLPHAVANGGNRTLYVCRAKGMTSLLKPDPDRLALFNEFPELGQVERELQVQTHRLDEIAEIGEMDFLKVDVQGSELEVFQSGVRKLARAVVVQTEISFVPLYRQQPAFGAVDTALRVMGFIPHCFAELKRWPIAPSRVDGNPRKPLRQLLEGDLVYVRDFVRPEAMDGEQWKHLALIAYHCYGSLDLALRAVRSAAKLGAVPADATAQYLEIVKSRGQQPK